MVSTSVGHEEHVSSRSLSQDIYCQQLPAFVYMVTPGIVCLLQHSLYGFKQAPRAWCQQFATEIRQVSFVASASDMSLFVYKEWNKVAYFLLYINDIVLTASSMTLLWHITSLSTLSSP
jgi:hypothetical protein